MLVEGSDLGTSNSPGNSSAPITRIDSASDHTYCSRLDDSSSLSDEQLESDDRIEVNSHKVSDEVCSKYIHVFSLLSNFMKFKVILLSIQ